jgi:hypothetical protein
VPRAVYSTRFLAFAAAGTSTETYTCPAGYVAVIRDIVGFSPAEGGGLVQVYLGESGAVLLNVASSSEGATVTHWTGHQVIAAGETFVALLLGGDEASVTVSGYLLTL